MPTRRWMALQLGADLLAEVGIERRERLVEQQNIGLQHQRSRQSHALTFAAGKLRRTARFLARELHQIEHVAHALVDVISGAPPQSELDVLAAR